MNNVICLLDYWLRTEVFYPAMRTVIFSPFDYWLHTGVYCPAIWNSSHRQHRPPAGLWCWEVDVDKTGRQDRPSLPWKRDVRFDNLTSGRRRHETYHGPYDALKAASRWGWLRSSTPSSRHLIPEQNQQRRNRLTDWFYYLSGSRLSSACGWAMDFC